MNENLVKVGRVSYFGDMLADRRRYTQTDMLITTLRFRAGTN